MPEPSLDDLARLYLEASDAIKLWEQRKADITDALSALHEAGTIPTKFTSASYAFSLQPGRTTVRYDDAGKLRMADLKADLLHQGHATEETGKPFWTARFTRKP